MKFSHFVPDVVMIFCLSTAQYHKKLLSLTLVLSRFSVFAQSKRPTIEETENRITNKISTYAESFIDAKQGNNRVLFIPKFQNYYPFIMKIKSLMETKLQMFLVLTMVMCSAIYVSPMFGQDKIASAALEFLHDSINWEIPDTNGGSYFLYEFNFNGYNITYIVHQYYRSINIADFIYHFSLADVDTIVPSRGNVELRFKGDYAQEDNNTYGYGAQSYHFKVHVVELDYNGGGEDAFKIANWLEVAKREYWRDPTF